LPAACLNEAQFSTAEGIVRLYRNYDPDLGNGPVQMVSSFRALNDVIAMKRGTGSGVVTDWKQQGGTLLVSGDSRVIRVWDAHTENQILASFLHIRSTVRGSSLKLRIWIPTPTAQLLPSHPTRDLQRRLWPVSQMVR